MRKKIKDTVHMLRKHLDYREIYVISYNQNSI